MASATMRILLAQAILRLDRRERRLEEEEHLMISREEFGGAFAVLLEILALDSWRTFNGVVSMMEHGMLTSLKGDVYSGILSEVKLLRVRIHELS